MADALTSDQATGAAVLAHGADLAAEGRLGVVNDPATGPDHVLVLPGGGYRRHAAHEGQPVAAWLEGLGIPASVLHYPVRRPHPEPLEAVQQAVRRLRAGGAGRIGLLGFSAGGHLAGLAALQRDSGVDAAILCYPVVSMVEAVHEGSREVLLGARPAAAAAAETSLERLVRPDSPPFFVWHTADDDVVPAANAHLLGLALARAGVPHELHVFDSGPHGLGLAVGHPAGAWSRLCAEWLRRQGWAAQA